MSLIDLEPTTDKEEQAILETARRFAREVLRPAGRELDALSDPAEVIASGSVLWDVMGQYRDVGFAETLGGAAGAGGSLGANLPRQARLQCLLGEELGWGDAGLAVSLGVMSFPRLIAQLSGNKALIDRFAAPGSKDIGCWAITEPDHGSDLVMFTEPHFCDPEVRPNCIARRDGEQYVISGQKAAWVSNGTIATVAALFCSIDPSRGLRGGGVLLVPLDLPGVSKGKPLNKLGQRALNQGEIFFDDVCVPASHMVVGADGYLFMCELILAMANASMGITFVGLARAALEQAIAYSKERIQGGGPIFRHQSVRARLFGMFTRVEAARSLARRVMRYNLTTMPPQIHYAIASKVFSTTAAFEVASEAVQIFGGNGLSREYPVEKLLRDARASMIEDGCNEVLALLGATKL